MISMSAKWDVALYQMNEKDWAPCTLFISFGDLHKINYVFWGILSCKSREPEIFTFALELSESNVYQEMGILGTWGGWVYLFITSCYKVFNIKISNHCQVVLIHQQLLSVDFQWNWPKSWYTKKSIIKSRYVVGCTN